MSELYRGGVRCDAPGCTAVAMAEAPSRELATTFALAKARACGWRLMRDRGSAAHDYDLCREHHEEEHRTLRRLVPAPNGAR